MENLAKYIDEKRDVGYMIGFDKGLTKFVSYLLQEDTKTLEQIADIAGTSEAFVKSVQNQIGSGNFLSK